MNVDESGPIFPSLGEAAKPSVASLLASDRGNTISNETSTEVATPKASLPTSPPSSYKSGRVADLCDSEEDSDDDLGSSKSKRVVVLLEDPNVELQLLPLVAEQPQHSFEIYIKRVPERLTAVNEVSWDNLQSRAAAPPLGGHVGKLEMFWIQRPGSKPAPESADGLVCFQFVQGAASNHARILHLSLTAPDQDPSCQTWQDVLPSAILEVKRLIFATLPVDSLRAVVLAAEDDGGRVYVNRDVEHAYQQCCFRWFQLTQSLKRSRSGLSRRRKVRPGARFMVLHTPRTASDPAAPRCNLGKKPALLLQSGAASEAEASEFEAACKAIEAATRKQESAQPAAVDAVSFTAW